MPPPIELVCFDWGGVILRICRTWDEAVRRAGLPLHEAAGCPDLAARRQGIALRFQLGRLEAAKFFELIATATAGCYTAEDIASVHHAWLCEEYAGVPQLIERAGRRVRTALLSNTNAAHYARGVSPVGPDFPAIGLLHERYASHLLGLAKPDDSIYARVAVLERTPPPRILFFDDTPENVDAARRGGWRAELIDHAGDTAGQMERHLRTHGLDV